MLQKIKCFKNSRQVCSTIYPIQNRLSFQGILCHCFDVIASTYTKYIIFQLLNSKLICIKFDLINWNTLDFSNFFRKIIRAIIFSSINIFIAFLSNYLRIKSSHIKYEYKRRIWVHICFSPPIQFFSLKYFYHRKISETSEIILIQ